MIRIIVTFCVSCWFLTFMSHAQNCTGSSAISVDVDQVLKVFTKNPVAMNLNYLMDDDSSLNPSTPIAQSLDNMGARNLRFPGGEKSDNYLWSVPPFSGVDPHFAVEGNCNWPNGDSRFSADALTPLANTLDFSEFMTLCSQVNANPFIVVSADAHLNDLPACISIPTLAELTTTAAEWVRYANVTNNYQIEHWMVGNESWNSSAYGSAGTPNGYASDLQSFYTAMKAVDPDIRVYANIKPGNWANTVLQNSATHLDGLALSNYPTWQWSNGYDTYRNGNPSFVNSLNNIINSINTHAPGQGIDIIVSEYNAIDWSNQYPNENDLGHSLVNLNMFLDQIEIPEVTAAYFWNTRWIDNVTDPQSIFDAIDANGNLNATASGLSLVGNHFLDEMVYSTDDGYIKSFVSANSAGDSLNILLINKDYDCQSTVIDINNFAPISDPNLVIDQIEFTGSSVEDKFPEVEEVAFEGILIDNQISIDLKGISATVINLSAKSCDINECLNVSIEILGE